MHNRRQHYRHAFPLSHRLRATCAKKEGGFSHAGEIVNLSVGGLCVKLDDSAVPFEGHVLIFLVLDGTDETLQVRAERVHAQQDRDRSFGLRFLFPIHAQTRENIERKISKYLFELQRYERQLLKESKKIT